MRVLQRCPCRLTVVLKDENVLESTVFLQIENSVTESPENVFDLLWRQGRQAGGVIVGFDNHFVRADSVHAIEHAFGLTVQVAFDSQGREFVRNYTDGPAWGIALWGRASIVVGTVGLNL